jgi:ketosteroid isomerase-like protein
MSRNADGAVRDVLSALQKGMHARDAAAVTALHEPNAAIYDLAPPLGDRPDEAALAQWLASWGGPVSEEWADLEIEVSGDLALCFGYVHVSVPTKSGEEASWWTRRTMGLKRGPDGWRIINDHMSVPFYMDGSDRAAMDLEPMDRNSPRLVAGA